MRLFSGGVKIFLERSHEEDERGMKGSHRHRGKGDGNEVGRIAR